MNPNLLLIQRRLAQVEDVFRKATHHLQDTRDLLYEEIIRQKEEK